MEFEITRVYYSLRYRYKTTEKTQKNKQNKHNKSLIVVCKKDFYSIGIKHGFSFINIRQVPS